MCAVSGDRVLAPETSERSPRCNQRSRPVSRRAVRRGSILGDHGAQERPKARGFGRPVVGRRAARDVDCRGGPGRPRWGFGRAPRQALGAIQGQRRGVDARRAILRRRRRLCAPRLFPGVSLRFPPLARAPPARIPPVGGGGSGEEIFSPRLFVRERTSLLHFQPPTATVRFRASSPRFPRRESSALTLTESHLPPL